MQSTMTRVAAIAVLAASANAAQAATLNVGDVLTIDAGNFTTSSSANIAYNGGSYFGMDMNSNEKINLVEATALSQGTYGITIGQANSSYNILFYGGDITATWTFNSAPGTNYVTTAVTGGTSGLDLSGWFVYWNGVSIDMGTGAWQSSTTNAGANDIFYNAANTYSNGTAVFNWNGVYGSGYTLDYTATVPSGPFIGTQYALHLEGTVQAVPEASTYGMMLAGLGLLGFAARRRKLAA